MRRVVVCTIPVLLWLAGCSGLNVDPVPPVFSDGGVEAGEPIGAATDAATDAALAPASDAAADAASQGGGCAVSGAPGQCMMVSACAALGDHTAYAGHCPGPADIQCCIKTPSTADNPPIPAGYKLMMQSQVTPPMTTWAVSILNDPATYPMFSTTTMAFGALMVLARVEWHAPDFQNSVVHRGVTLYEPL